MVGPGSLSRRPALLQTVSLTYLSSQPLDCRHCIRSEKEGEREGCRKREEEEEEEEEREGGGGEEEEKRRRRKRKRNTKKKRKWKKR